MSKLTLFFLLIAAAWAPGVTARAEIVEIGMYVTDLHSFNFASRTYDANFWLWLKHGPGFAPEKTLDFVNSQDHELRQSLKLADGGKTLSQLKYKVRLHIDWNAKDYPFDRQVLRIAIEDGRAGADRLRFTVDSAASGIDPQVILPGWKVEGFRIHEWIAESNSNFGESGRAAKSSYSRVEGEITIKRIGLGILFNIYIGFFSSIVLTMLIHFIALENASSRFSLATSSVFAAMGNKYILDAQIPPSSVFSLYDKIQLATFLLILASLISTVFAMRFHKRSPKLAMRLDRWMIVAGGAVIALYLGTAIVRAYCS